MKESGIFRIAIVLVLSINVTLQFIFELLFSFTFSFYRIKNFSPTKRHLFTIEGCFFSFFFCIFIYSFFSTDVPRWFFFRCEYWKIWINVPFVKLLNGPKMTFCLSFGPSLILCCFHFLSFSLFLFSRTLIHPHKRSPAMSEKIMVRINENLRFLHQTRNF